MRKYTSFSRNGNVVSKLPAEFIVTVLSETGLPSDNFFNSMTTSRHASGRVRRRAGDKVPTPEIGRKRMLSDDFVKTYQKLYEGLAPLAAANGLPYRLEEVNNFYNGGAAGVSDSFASGLWGVDFMY